MATASPLSIYDAFENNFPNITDRDIIIRNLFFLFPFGYVVPTMGMQLVLLYILLRPKNKKAFRFGFHRFVAVGLINDLIGFCSGPMANRGMFAPLMHSYHEFLQTHQIYAALALTISQYCLINQAFNIFLISVNRFVVMCRSTTSKVFWRKYTDHFTVIFVLFPLPFIWQIGYCGVMVNIMDIQVGHIASYQCTVFPTSEVCAMILQFLLAIGDLALNVSVLTQIVREYRIPAAHRQAKHDSKIENRLTIYTIIIVFTQVFFAAATLYLTLTLAAMRTAAEFITAAIIIAAMQLIIDACSLSTTWFLIIMSSAVRSRLSRHRRLGTISSKPVTLNNESNSPANHKSGGQSTSQL